MSNISVYLSQAELALAAYSDLQPGIPNIDRLQRDGDGMSLSQSEEFARHWRVLDQYNGRVEETYIDEFGQEHTYLNPTGLSVTAFEHMETGQQVVAIRGTEPTDLYDLRTDVIDIGYIGTAEKQDQYAALRAKIQDWLDSGTLQSGFNVTGHSLGGFLAINLTIDYSADIVHTYLYNSPGVTGLIGGIYQEIHNALSPGNPIDIPYVLPISNIIATGDVVSSVGMYVAPPLMMSVETRSPFGAHSIAGITDALAIYNLFSCIDANTTLSGLSTILDAASNQENENESLEVMVHALSELLMDPIEVPTGNRDALYQAIQAIETELFDDRTVAVPQLKPAYQNLRVISLPGLTQDQLVDRANNDIAYRYALAHLNTFAITGRESLYDEHNQNGEFELYNEITLEGELTQHYLTDCAAFLVTLNEFNRTNESIVGQNLIEFQDWDNGLLRRSAMITATGDRISQRFLFGNEQSDTLTGGTDNDHLYGGGGNDILSGAAGNDYLEGNAGADQLNGGVGDDELHGGAGNDGGAGLGLYGGAGDDALYGDAGNDTLGGGTERDLLVGGLGQDTLRGGDDHDFIIGGYHYLDEANHFFHIFDDGEADRLEGGEGDDVYWAGAGDIINDTDGKGRINFSVTLESGAQAYVTLGEWGIRQTEDPNRYVEYNEFLDYTLHYTYDEVSQTLTVEDSMTIEHFSNFDFVIGLGSPSVRLMFANSYWFAMSEDGTLKPPEAYYVSFDPRWISEFKENEDPDVDNTDDNIIGTDGDDEIHSDGGDDLVVAGDGDDLVHGDSGNDRLRGDGGDDWLYGDEGNDQLSGGEGVDRLFGGLGNDILRGGLGDGDVLNGGRGNDTYLFALGDGDTTINNFDNILGKQDVLRFLDGVSVDDVSTTRSDYDLLLSLPGSGETITVTDYFVGDGVGYSVDLITFAGGAQWDVDEIKVRVQQATDGDDNLYGYSEADTLDGLAGNDTLYGMSGNDILRGGAGNDRLSGGADNDQLNGNAGDDLLYGNDGNDNLFGGTGVDEIYGGEGNDWLRGYTGDGDILNGGAGNDTYVFIAGDGDTIINNHDTGADRLDVLYFRGGIEPGDISVSRTDYDLRLTLQSSGEVITVTGFFLEEDGWTRALDVIQFEDGTRWDIDTVLARALQASEGTDTLFGYSGADTIDGLAGNDTLVGEGGDDTLIGGAGDDLLYGGTGNDRLEGGEGDDGLSGDDGDDYLIGGEGQDTLFGGAGNDTLECGLGGCSGGSGNDTYLHRAGSGNLVIDNGDPDGQGEDVLILAGVAMSSVTFARTRASGHEGDLILRYSITDTQGNEGLETVTVQGYFEQSGATGQTIDRITFDDVSLDFDAIVVQMMQSTEEQDVLYADDNGSTLHGLGGGDTLYGMAGNDQLYGDAGSDHLYGGGGNDTLVGGEGVDWLYGETGSDLYLFDVGDGIDGIVDYTEAGSGEINTIRLGEGFTRDNVIFRPVQPTEGLVSPFAPPSYEDFPGSSLLIESRDSDDSLYVSNYFWDSKNPNDHRVANFTIEFWDGSQISKEEMVALFTLPTEGADYFLGNADANTAHLLAGDDLARGYDGDDVLYGEDGDDRLDGDAGNDQLFGGAGDDLLSGGYGDDTLRGGPGNDQLEGGHGNNVYLFGVGDGHNTINTQALDSYDTVRFLAGIEVGDVSLSREERDLIITLSSGDDRITVSDYFIENAAEGYMLDAIAFADGTVWDGQTIWDRFTQPTAGDDLLFAADTGSVLDGLAGDDTLVGAQGDDQLSGGDGNDFIQGQGGGDILRGNAGNDYLFGDAGNDQLNGGAGEDVLHGGDGDDRLIATSGVNTLSGGLGNDIYILTAVAGQNVIQNHNGFEIGSIDKIVFTAAVDPETVLLSRTDNDLVLDYSGATTRIENYFIASGNNRINTISFQDGTSWGYDDVRAMLLRATDGDDHLIGYETDDQIDGGAGNDTINGVEGNDQLLGGTGSDFLDGGNGNDQLDGGAGDDTLEGWQGNDELNGGVGNDYLAGSHGDDIYYFKSGDGQDIIDDRLGNNTIVFSDLESTRLDVMRSGDDLILTDHQGGGQITVVDQFTDGADTTTANAVQEIRFSDEVIWNADDIADQLSAGGAGGDVIDGTGGPDIIEALAGDDDVFAHEGDDCVDGGAGDDYLMGGTGNDLLLGGNDNDFLFGQQGNDHLQGGAGNDFLFGSQILPNHSQITDPREYIAYENYGWDNWRYPMWVQRTWPEYDLLAGGEGSDVIVGAGELYGGAGGDRLFGSGVLYGEAGDDYIVAHSVVHIEYEAVGNAYADYHREYADNITLVGGEGDDFLQGNGEVTYVFERGDGQDIILNGLSSSEGNAAIVFGEGIGTTDIHFERQGNDLMVRYGEPNDRITIVNWFSPRSDSQAITYPGKIDLFKFADGTIITSDEAEAGLGNTSETTSGDDTQQPVDEDRTLTGDDGSNSLFGGSGNDSLDGQGGVDTLWGNDGNDTLRDGPGNGTMQGGEGSDTYLYGIGDGSCFIENQDGDGGVDVLRFLEGILPEDVVLTRNRTNLQLTLNGETITVVGHFQNDGLNDYALDAVEFTDGSGWTQEDIAVRVSLGTAQADTLYGDSNGNSLDGLAGNDSLIGVGGDDRLGGGEGNDDLYGVDGDDILVGDGGDDSLCGGAGDDSLDGGEGNDILYGGLGNDTLMGGYGSDTYLIGAAEGQDIIDNFDADDTGSDTLRFESVAIDDLWFNRNGNDLMITLAGTDDRVTLAHWYDAPANEVDRIEAAGSVLPNNQVDQLVAAMAAYDVPAGVGNVIPQNVKDELQIVIAETWQTA